MRLFQLYCATWLTLACVRQSQAEPNTCTIQCQVLLDREIPGSPTVVVDKTPEVCGTNVTDALLTGNGRAVKDAVIFLEFKDMPASSRPPKTTNESVFVRTEGCLFWPRIQAARTGATLLLNSKDPTPHNPHGWHRDITAFNLTLLDPTMSFHRKLKMPGMYRIDCDTHKWMKAYVFAFDHPYFALTDENGRASITNVSNQRFTVNVWHEVLGEKRVELGPMQTAVTNVVFVFPLEDKRKADLKPVYSREWPPR
jgi:plastocyanin